MNHKVASLKNYHNIREMMQSKGLYLGKGLERGLVEQNDQKDRKVGNGYEHQSGDLVVQETNGRATLST